MSGTRKLRKTKMTRTSLESNYGRPNSPRRNRSPGVSSRLFSRNLELDDNRPQRGPERMQTTGKKIMHADSRPSPRIYSLRPLTPPRIERYIYPASRYPRCREQDNHTSRRFGRSVCSRRNSVKLKERKTRWWSEQKMRKHQR